MRFDEHQLKFVQEDFSDNTVEILLAVAGAGKSTSMVARLNRIFSQNKNITPDNVVVTTFTNRMAGDIRKKFHKQNIKIDYLGTMHRISLKLMERKGFKPNIITDWEASKITRDYFLSLKQYESTPKRELNKWVNLILNHYSYARAVCNPGMSFSDRCSHDFVDNNLYKGAIEYYENVKRDKSLFDFDDLLSKRATDIIGVCDSIKWVLVDEAQDNSKLNYQFLFSVYPNASYTLIGDTLQMIYDWRGSFVGYMQEPHKYFKNRNIKIFKLQYNYRSNPSIIKFYNIYRSLIDDLMALSTNEEKPKSVSVKTVEMDYHIPILIRDHINQYLEEGYNYNDMVVLVRKSSFIKSVLEPVFTSSGIPYKVRTPQYKKKFFEIPYVF
jgi:DNA helicase-2/ATP-dependent DNA helicase PcrA